MGHRTTEPTLLDGYSPAADDVQTCPYPYYDALRAGPGPHRIHGTNHYVVSRYEQIAHVARHPEQFSNKKYWQSDDDPDLAAIVSQQRFPIEPALVDNDPPSHTIYRRIASRAFSPGRLREVEPAIRGTCEELIRGFAERGEAEFISDFCRPLPMRVVCDLLGVPREMGGNVGVWSDSYLALAGRQLPKETALVCQRHVVDLNNYLADLLEERRRYPGADVISELTAAQTPDGRPLDLVELSAIVRNLITAAGETTSFMLGNAMLQLLEHPAEMKRVAGDARLIPRMIEESLRRETPQQWNWRQVVQTAELGGVEIPAGAWVQLVWAAGNRDPSVFDASDQFEVGRRNVSKQLAFGLGIHFCLGAPLARMEGRLAFEALLARTRDLRLADRPDAVVHRKAATSRSLTQLHIQFSPASR
jgi:cytochrome P450